MNLTPTEAAKQLSAAVRNPTLPLTLRKQAANDLTRLASEQRLTLSGSIRELCKTTLKSDATTAEQIVSGDPNAPGGGNHGDPTELTPTSTADADDIASIQKLAKACDGKQRPDIEAHNHYRLALAQSSLVRKAEQRGHVRKSQELVDALNSGGLVPATGGLSVEAIAGLADRSGAVAENVDTLTDPAALTSGGVSGQAGNITVLKTDTSNRTVGGVSGSASLIPHTISGTTSSTYANPQQGLDASLSPAQKQRLETIQKLDSAAKALRECQRRSTRGVVTKQEAGLGELVYRLQRTLQIEAGR